MKHLTRLETELLYALSFYGDKKAYVGSLRETLIRRGTISEGVGTDTLVYHLSLLEQLHYVVEMHAHSWYAITWRGRAAEREAQRIETMDADACPLQTLYAGWE